MVGTFHGPHKAAIDLTPQEPVLRRTLARFILQFELTLQVRQPQTGVQFANFSGDASLQTKSQPLEHLAPLHLVQRDYLTHGIYLPYTHSPQLSFYASLTAIDIEAIERARNGDGLTFVLDISAYAHEAPHGHAAGNTTRARIEVRLEQSAWVRILNASGWSDTLLVELPNLSSSPSLVGVAPYFNASQRALRRGDWRMAVLEVRKALEKVTENRGDAAIISQPPSGSPRALDKQARIASLRRALIVFAHPAAHSDASAELHHFEREDALAAFQMLAGLLRLIGEADRGN